MLYRLRAVPASMPIGRVITKSERFTIITRQGYRPRLLQLCPGAGRLRPCALYLALSRSFPSRARLCSFLALLRLRRRCAFASMDWSNYVSRVSRPTRIGRTLWNTLVMTARRRDRRPSSISFLIRSWGAVKIWGRSFSITRLLARTPIPGMSLELALLWSSLHIYKLCAPSAFLLPPTLFFRLHRSFLQFHHFPPSFSPTSLWFYRLVHKDLEDAANVSGAPQGRIFCESFFPLLQRLLSESGSGPFCMWYARPAIFILTQWRGERIRRCYLEYVDQGSSEAAGAIGTLLMLALLAAASRSAFLIGRGALFRRRDDCGRDECETLKEKAFEARGQRCPLLPFVACMLRGAFCYAAQSLTGIIPSPALYGVDAEVLALCDRRGVRPCSRCM